MTHVSMRGTPLPEEAHVRIERSIQYAMSRRPRPDAGPVERADYAIGCCERNIAILQAALPALQGAAAERARWSMAHLRRRIESLRAEQRHAVQGRAAA